MAEFGNAYLSIPLHDIGRIGLDLRGHAKHRQCRRDETEDGAVDVLADRCNQLVAWIDVIGSVKHCLQRGFCPSIERMYRTHRVALFAGDELDDSRVGRPLDCRFLRVFDPLQPLDFESRPRDRYYPQAMNDRAAQPVAVLPHWVNKILRQPCRGSCRSAHYRHGSDRQNRARSSKPWTSPARRFAAPHNDHR